MSRQKNSVLQVGRWRLNVVRLVFISLVLGLAWRLTDIQVLNSEFLRSQGDARHLRNVTVSAHRGMILDRHNQPLAISTPVDSVWLNPQQVSITNTRLPKLAKLLSIETAVVKEKITSNKTREFVYLKRRISPELALKVKHLKIAGVALQREYKRYYPAGEVTAHLLGFTNVDDQGQEGLELTHDATLTGVSGLKRMMRDRYGRYVGGGEQIKVSKPGQDIQLSIDLRLQYLSYQALKSAVNKYHARSGSAVILDIKTGEVLAMVNQPAFNPNNRVGLSASDYRNRAVIDLFEPGSTAKPFTVAAGLQSGKFNVTTKVNTSPGSFKVSGHVIKDHHNLGNISLATLIQKSSNVGASKVALALEPEELWQGFSSFGLSEPTGAYFPGEAMGHLPDLQSWRKFDRATLAFGYGMATSSLQLARAYMVLANGGILRPVSLQKVEQAPAGRKVYSSDVMKQVLSMMEAVTLMGGTAKKAAVVNYTVAGKTGTAIKAANGGYAVGKYVSLFAGVIPASNPRLAMVVMIDEPQGKVYYGGLVAGPVFSEVMTGAMRILNITPDNLSESKMLVAKK
jgi:cell division protein FtsI (penicillin-binding protein 3)